MTDQERFHRLICFAKKLYRFRVQMYWTDGITRGRAVMFRRRPSKIIVWIHEAGRPKDFRDATAALIHEIGHCVLRYVAHSEREAWAWGRRAVPAETVPASSWKSYKRKCLKSYPKRQRDARYNGAFGRAWKWVPKESVS